MWCLLCYEFLVWVTTYNLHTQYCLFLAYVHQLLPQIHYVLNQGSPALFPKSYSPVGFRSNPSFNWPDSAYQPAHY